MCWAGFLHHQQYRCIPACMIHVLTAIAFRNLLLPFFAGYFLWLKTFFGTCFAHWPQNANQWVRAIFKRIWSHWSRSTQCFGPKHSSLNRQSQSYWFGHVWDLLRCLMILMCGTHTTTMPKRKFGATSRFPRCLFLFPTYLTETSIQNQHLNLIHILLFR